MVGPEPSAGGPSPSCFWAGRWLRSWACPCRPGSPAHPAGAGLFALVAVASIGWSPRGSGASCPRYPAGRAHAARLGPDPGLARPDADPERDADVFVWPVHPVLLFRALPEANHRRHQRHHRPDVSVVRGLWPGGQHGPLALGRPPGCTPRGADHACTDRRELAALATGPLRVLAAGADRHAMGAGLLLIQLGPAGASGAPVTRAGAGHGGAQHLGHVRRSGHGRRTRAVC